VLSKYFFHQPLGIRTVQKSIRSEKAESEARAPGGRRSGAGGGCALAEGGRRGSLPWPRTQRSRTSFRRQQAAGRRKQSRTHGVHGCGRRARGLEGRRWRGVPPGQHLRIFPKPYSVRHAARERQGTPTCLARFRGPCDCLCNRAPPRRLCERL